MTARLLVIMGSGETAPTMVKPHRVIFERVGPGPAILLDTPYGFQENVDDISTRAVRYFADSVGRRVDVVNWRTAPPAGLARERALAAIGDAEWIFSGPGSPTYALRHWRDTPLPGALVDRLERGGVVLFASAAAVTLGSHAIPVYEIYKAGIEPCWAPGLDLMRRVTGLPAVIIPHYNNAEGGNHDTRFCYLGERRLSTMERELPGDTFILGVDEHTALVVDLDAGQATVLGNGTVTVRRQGRSVAYPPGSVLAVDRLASDDAGAPVVPPSIVDTPEESPGPADSLGGEAERLSAAFDAALAVRDVDACVAAILDLEQAIRDWAADTNISDEADQARAALRRMVVRLGELAVAGARDPRDVLRPFVEPLLELRARARAARDFATSDTIRDRLTAAGVEVRDTPTGADWTIH